MSSMLKQSIVPAIIILPSLYFWKRFLDTYFSLRQQIEEKELFYKKHNCIITYSRKAFRGWPPETININKSNLSSVLEPHLYFINSARTSLDVAMMAFAIDELVEAVCQASRRGVKVRLMVNFLSVKLMSKKYNHLKKSGVEAVFYLPKSNNLNYIMHFKYMLKDYDLNGGFLCMGSMNYTQLSSILDNYEDTVFTTKPLLVSQFKNNFEQSWDTIKKDNEDVFNKTVISEAGFIQ